MVFGLDARGRGRCDVHRLQSLAYPLLFVGIHLQESLEALASGAPVPAIVVFDAECLDGPHAGLGRGETPPCHVIALGLGDRILQGMASHDRRLEM